MSPRFPLIFHRHVVRHLRRHKLLAALNVLAVALGVAVFVAIRIANHSAQAAFAAGIEVVAGKANLEVRGEIDETLLPKISGAPEIAAATPLIEQLVTLPDFPGEYLRVLGLDVFTNEPFRTFEIGKSAGDFQIERWLAAPDGIAIAEGFAREHGLHAGDTIRAVVNGETRLLTITFLLAMGDAPAGADVPFAAMDLGWAQELFGMRGRLSSVQIVLRDPLRSEQAVKQLKSIVPAHLSVAPPRQRSAQIETMLGSFRLNLSALSMISLLVGTFLIYNTISASAARRRVEIGILRSLGATRWEVRALFLGEALLLGGAGIAVGLIGGIALAQMLVGTIGKTISSLYVLVSIRHPVLGAPQFFLAALAGAATVLIGAWVPANDAAKSDPVEALALSGKIERSPRIKLSWAFAAIGALGLALLCSALALRGQPWLGFGAAFLVLFGFALLAPAATQLARFVLHRTPRILVRIAAENLLRSSHRNAVTIASLSAAVAMMIGLSMMIFSFRSSVDAWIERGIIADLFIAPAANEIIGLHAFVPREIIDGLEHMQGVASVDTYRAAEALMRGEPVEIGVVKGADRRNLRFAGGNERHVMERFFSGENAVLITESFAQKQRVRDGDLLPVETPAGLQHFQVAGTYRDYTSDRGLMMMNRALFEKYWRDPRVQSLAVHLAPGADAEKVRSEFLRRFNGGGEFLAFPNRTLRERILSIFDQTFAVTYVLRVIAILVAAVGIFLSVTALVVERGREIGILRALGASAAQVRRLFLTEAAMIGGIASALGIAAGIGLAMVLTWVINKAFFGWTIDLRWPWLLLATTPLWICAVSVTAAWWPAAQASRIPIATAVRSE